MKPLVSIIIPVYDVERYLPACLDSVIEQTFQDYEVICVNDGSPDNSCAILNEYAARDARIQVISQKNSGLSVARNTGMIHAAGKYILFLDSDDCLKPNAVETLYTRAEADNLDHIIFAAEVFFDGYKPEEDEWTAYYAHRCEYGSIKSGPEAFADLVLNKDYVYAAQLRFSLRSRLVQQKLMFRPGMIHEDTLFSFMNDLSAKRTLILDEKLYLFRKRVDSITTGALSIKHMIGYFVSFIESLRFVEYKNYSERVQRAINRDLNRKYRAACRDFRNVTNPQIREGMWLECPMAEQLMRFLVEKPLPDASQVNRFTEHVRQPLVSVIVPVYNTQDYLVECLESIRNQTLRNIEVICVDDGSTDFSPVILQFYQLLDSRFKVLSGSGQGGGAARNLGLRFAFGKYLAFFDADDWADTSLLQKMVDKAVKEDSDVAVCRSYRYSHMNQQITRETTFPRNLIACSGPVTYRNTGTRLLIDFGNQPWGKLFLRSFVKKHQLSFQEIARANDLRFTQLAHLLADRISIVDEALYYYRTDIPQSLQATLDSSPLLMFEAWHSFKEAAQASGRFDENVKLSLANAVWNGSLFSYDKLHTREAKQALFDAVKAKEYDAFDMSLMNEHTCLNQNSYHRLQAFRRTDTLESWEVEAMKADESPIVS